MADVTNPKAQFEQLSRVVLDHEAAIGTRMRSIFELRTLGTEDSRKCLIKALRDKDNSILMRHELAYVLGQMQNVSIYVSVPSSSVYCNFKFIGRRMQ